MGKKRKIGIQFPLGGLDKQAAYRQQKPYTSPDLLNVRPLDTICGRERGGSRPGLTLSHLDDIGSEVRFLAPMTLALGDGFTNFSDNFDGTGMSSSWSAATWTAVPALPVILPSIPAASIDTTVSEGEAVLDALPIDTAQPYTVEMFVVPWAGAFHGKYRLYLRLHDTTPAIGTAGVRVEMSMTGTSGTYTMTITNALTVLQTVTGTMSSIRAGWLTASVTANAVSVYWAGTTIIASQAVSAPAGKRVGFGLKCTEAGGLSLANSFRVQYYSTGEVPSLRSMLIASSGGNLYKESTYGRLTAISSALTVRDDVALTTCQDGQDLYIADYGDVPAASTDGSVAGTTFDDVAGKNWSTLGVDADDMVVVISNVTGTAVAGTYKIQTVSTTTLTLTATAGTGNCSYRIERAPKKYDPLTNTISILTATSGSGQVPTGCPLVCRFMDRIVFAGADIAPHVWYMGRQGNPLDWDYSQEDAQRAVAGTASAAGVPGEPIVALAPHSDDYLVIGCRNSLWRMRGDPASGGQLDALSHAIGIVGPKAWCIVPSGELVFLSRDGLYALAAGGDSFPISLSREVIPRDLLNLNPDTLDVSLEYDIQGRGVHVFLTSTSENSRYHWWLDWSRKTFWPMSLTVGHEPTATCSIQATAIEESGVLLGGRDGKIRRFNDLADDDFGTTFSSYAVIGPIALAPDADVGTVLDMDAVIAEDSGNVTWQVKPSLTFEGAGTADYQSSGTWIAGLNATVRPDGRGQAFTMKLSGTAGRRWALENIVATIKSGGKRRIA